MGIGVCMDDEHDLPGLYSQPNKNRGNNMSLLEKLKAAGSIKVTTLADSTLFNEKEMCPTEIPIINVALSGKLDGGLSSGLTILAGPSKHFKSSLGLLLVKAYMKQYPDAVCLFYDSEFGITTDYTESFGIDPNRVLHIPIEHIEQLKFDISKRLEEIKREDKVVIFVDSVGNLASKKEVEDALDEKSVADMSRSKAMKSLFRIITPHLTTKDIPAIVINHTYKEIGMFPKDVVSGGTGIYYSANNIFIIGRQQEKDSEGIKGWNFVLNIEKSRFVKEKSKLIFQVTYDGGISKWGGLLDEALAGGFVVKPSNGWYSRKGEDKKYRLADTDTKDFWLPIITTAEFQEYITDKYQLAYRSMFNGDFEEDE